MKKTKTVPLGMVEKNERGFLLIRFVDYHGQSCRLQMSSVTGDYEDSVSRPGTSALWLGFFAHEMHLNRKQVRELVTRLQEWLKDGKFKS